MIREQTSRYDLVSGLSALLSGGSYKLDDDGSRDVTVITPAGWRPPSPFYRAQIWGEWCIYSDEIVGMAAEGFVEVDPTGLPTIPPEVLELVRAYVAAAELLRREG